MNAGSKNGRGPQPIGELLDRARVLTEWSRTNRGIAQGRDSRSDRIRPVTRCLQDVTPETVEWLFRGRIALGKFSLLEGHPGLGKSTLLSELAARVTLGRGLSGEPDTTPAGVLLLNAEEGAGDTIRPRMEAAGGDCSRVHLLDAFAGPDGTAHDIVLGDPADLRSIEAMELLIRRHGIKLVVIDVLMAYLSPKRDSYRDQDIRLALRPLAELAERNGCAVVAIRHLRKSAGGGAITAGVGSIGIAGAARSQLLVDRDPNHPERRVLAMVKNNLAPLAPSLSFVIEGADGGSGKITWLGESEWTAEALTQARAMETPRTDDRSRGQECAEFLGDLLAEGPMERKEVIRAALARGFRERTIDRAAGSMGILRAREGFGPSLRSFWRLPAVPPIGGSSATPPAEAGLAEVAGDGATVEQAIEAERRAERACIEHENDEGWPSW